MKESFVSNITRKGKYLETSLLCYKILAQNNRKKTEKKTVNIQMNEELVKILRIIVHQGLEMAPLLMDHFSH